MRPEYSCLAACGFDAYGLCSHEALQAFKVARLLSTAGQAALRPYATKLTLTPGELRKGW